MSSNQVGSNNKIDLDYPKPSDYLSEDEKKYLKRTDELANLIEDQSRKKSDFFELSLNDILRNWSNNIQAILIDITNEIDINKTIKNTDNFYEFITTFLGQLWHICTKEYRIIYFGITLIFISILIYFVVITN